MQAKLARSYVQSKGRARAKPSCYLVMVGDQESRSDQESKLQKFRAIEELSLKVCHQSQDSEDKVNQFIEH